MVVYREKAIAFVRKHGDAIENSRLDGVVHRVEPSRPTLEALAAMQNPDGGFAYWLSDSSISTVCDTAYVLGWLDDLSLRTGPVAEQAVAFILAHQKEDGGWDEVPAVSNLNPPEFLRPGEQKTRVWLTAYCAHWLLLFGYADTPECRACPIKFLLEHRDESGRLPGYLRATWDALPVYCAFPELSADASDRALKVIGREFSPEEWAASYLAWLLRCLRDAGLAKDHSLVRRSLEGLIRKQRSDGGWDSEDGDRYAPSATVEVLRLLHDFGEI